PRLGIHLAPPIHTREDTRQKFLFLCGIAECGDDRADHGHAEREWRQRPGTSRLLLEDKALRDRPARPAVLFGPERRDPSLLVKDTVPEQHLLLGKVGFRIGNAHFRGIVLRDEGTHLVTKRSLLTGKIEFHCERLRYHFSPNGRISSSKV